MSGVPVGPPVAPATPVPAAFLNATTVSIPSKPACSGVAVTTAPASLPAALAAQLSETPDWGSLRLTSDHGSAPPESVDRCEPAAAGPSCETKATISSPAGVVVSAGAVSALFARRFTDASIEIVAGAGALLSTVTSTGLESV